jgi:hypothetical protein
MVFMAGIFPIREFSDAPPFRRVLDAFLVSKLRSMKQTRAIRFNAENMQTEGAKRPRQQFRRITSTVRRPESAALNNCRRPRSTTFPYKADRRRTFPYNVHEPEARTF